MDKYKEIQKGTTIMVKERGLCKTYRVDNITHLVCDEYLTNVYLKDNKQIIVTKLLKKFEEELSEYGFLRVNRNTLVNMAFFDSYL